MYIYNKTNLFAERVATFKNGNTLRTSAANCSAIHSDASTPEMNRSIVLLLSIRRRCISCNKCCDSDRPALHSSDCGFCQATINYI